VIGMGVYKGLFTLGPVTMGLGVALSGGKLPGKVILALSSKH